MFPHIRDDLFHRSSRLKDFRYTAFLEFWYVLIGNNTADDDKHVVEPLFLHQIHDSRAERHMRSREYGESDYIRVFLQRSIDDLFWRLPEAGIDHLESSIAESARNDFGAAIVAVQTGLSNDDADLVIH